MGESVWFILPAYVANATPVVLGGGARINGGKHFMNGRPIFGAGKTIRGFLTGLITGSLAGVLQGFIVGDLCTYPMLGFLLALGALLGDLAGSFIKRRAGIRQGGAAPGLDQLGFLVVALLLALPIMTPSWEMVLVLVLITPPIHFVTNLGGYALGLKSRFY
ncbi:hypothetical protein AKJ35_00480 [candidate division MSBL1 archaeon SCGC-AAA833F18]|uniref:CDP-archaeol synthase n=2 Tax=candidate division MSBL1 TaxID=215777 RepID=A0A133VRX7_9EURY|nr:hypothetical protein AKJ46_00825 [candidate division MSBL1 archaeon SCGC-AAA833K04]KXB09636.1 hypothetical protein AKJ35_00480 [candidate division MSBL1 archaeon SCGC-AAA833F18]